MALHFNSARRAFLTSAIALTVGLAACQQTPPTGPQGAGSTAGGNTAANTNSGGGQTVALSGAGASFPAPLYQRWFSEYNKQNPNIQISYQSVGSGAGVKQFLAETVDFGASDAPLKEDERQQFPAKRGQAIQIPMTGGSVVFAYNLDGVDNLKLSREAYCGIVQGDIKTWNDPKIAAANSGVNLPSTPITFVNRSDGSGTTFIFTTHLKAACPNWKAGASKSVEWPTGFVGAKGNEGVTAQIQQTAGAIGYTEYSYAKENNLKSASVQNKAGEFIAPSPEAAAKAFAGVTVPEDFALVIPDPDAKDAYPINGLTWLLLYSQYDNPAKADALKNMAKWALSEGDKYAQELGYVPLPDELANRVVATLDTIKVAAATPTK
jgi:phosphate transport system substrate-binding protein